MSYIHSSSLSPIDNGGRQSIRFRSRQAAAPLGVSQSCRTCVVPIEETESRSVVFGPRCKNSAGRLFVLALSVIVSIGCASDRYYAKNLPAELVAPPVENPHTLDLSRLGTTPVGSEVVDRGDVLEISISAGLSAEDTITFPVRVMENGSASLPVVGAIPLAGLELEGAEAAIAAACVQQGLYRSPHITVTMKKQRTNRVTVIGAVSEPGIYDLPRGASDLLSALVAGGGLSEDAGMNVEVRLPAAPNNRPLPAIRLAEQNAEVGSSAIEGAGFSQNNPTQSARTIRVNLGDAARKGTTGFMVPDGGIVRVERRDPTPIHVLGLVRKPDRYEYPIAEELRVLDAIALAGGTSSPVANKVFVIRRLENQKKPAVIQLSLHEAKRNGKVNLRLTPGDVVSVEQTTATVFLDAIQKITIGVTRGFY